MGWCRCTYLNCTARSDGKTHFYHYPVFDKVRCHQWLVNAQRLDFLNLKLSQLKNRVICEHHFRDEMFMNCKKERLVSNAVPTEHGPFVQGNAEITNQNCQLFNMIKGQIENENIIPDKKANLSVKYGDFLFNNEMEYLLELQLDPNEIEEKVQITQEHVNDIKSEESEQKLMNITTQDKLSVPLMNQTIKQETVKNYIIQNQENMIQEVQINPNVMSIHYTPQREETKKKPKINILSEEKYSTINEKLVPLVSGLIPISPSFVLNPQEIKNNSKHTEAQKHNTTSDMSGTNAGEYEILGKHTVNAVQDETVISSTTKSEINTPTPENYACSNKIITRSKSLLADSPNKPHHKKISSERLEAIERKRKINKKIKEIINESLNSIDEQKKESKIGDTDVHSYLSTDPKLPKKEEYLIKYLDARIKQMENTLLHRIDVNSKRIKDLKDVVENKVNDAAEKKQSLLLSQTDVNLNKRRLFEEIKQYLSSESKNLVYEDLFLKEHFESAKEKNNKYVNKRPRRCK